MAEKEAPACLLLLGLLLEYDDEVKTLKGGRRKEKGEGRRRKGILSRISTEQFSGAQARSQGVEMNSTHRRSTSDHNRKLLCGDSDLVQ